MPAVLKSKLGPILLAAQARLVAAGVVPAERGRLSAKATPPQIELQGDRYALVIPLEQASEPGAYLGGGRKTTLARTRLDVYLRTTSGRDDPGGDEVFLADAADGVFALAHAVEDALHEWFPADVGGNLLTAEPFQWSRTGRPQRDKHDRLRGDVVAEFSFLFWKNYS